MIQELKNHLHQVFKFSENSLLRTKQEAEKQQKVDFRASQVRLAKTQQDILALRAQYHNLVHVFSSFNFDSHYPSTNYFLPEGLSSCLFSDQCIHWVTQR